MSEGIYERLLGLYNASRFTGWAYAHTGRQWGILQRALDAARRIKYGIR